MKDRINEIIYVKKMDIEISVGIIALGFIVLVVFLVRVLIDLRKTIKKANTLLTKFERISEGSAELVENVTHSLNALLHPFTHKQFKSGKGRQLKKPYNVLENVADGMDCVSSGIHLFNRIKGGSKAHDKAR